MTGSIYELAQRIKESYTGWRRRFQSGYIPARAQDNNWVKTAHVVESLGVEPGFYIEALFSVSWLPRGVQYPQPNMLFGDKAQEAFLKFSTAFRPRIQDDFDLQMRYLTNITLRAGKQLDTVLLDKYYEMFKPWFRIATVSTAALSEAIRIFGASAREEIFKNNELRKFIYSKPEIYERFVKDIGPGHTVSGSLVGAHN